MSRKALLKYVLLGGLIWLYLIALVVRMTLKSVLDLAPWWIVLSPIWLPVVATVTYPIYVLVELSFKARTR